VSCLNIPVCFVILHDRKNNIIFLNCYRYCTF
jgi:hypothetical protein